MLIATTISPVAIVCSQTMQPRPAADISGDGTVDVSEVNTIINIMLGKQ